ncbi:hypothetical protein ACFOHU_17565 [Ottowia pentelensis]|uniref:Histidine kinase n=1 Tax=Ottowia pentelensis TaxID=511108 RepID=A0ABV6PX84_9BURK
MNSQIIPESYPQVNNSSQIAIANDLGAQLEHDLFRIESLLLLLTISSGATALAELDIERRQAVLGAVAQMATDARQRAHEIESLAD